MTQALQSGQHPDADQLSAFVEHVLPLHEQQQMLAHLASCSDCRAIVYFSQEASLDAPMQPQPIATRKPWFSGWNLFTGGWKLAWPAAAALACLVLVTIHLRNAAKVDHKDAVDKTAQLEQTPPLLPATPPPAEVVPPKPAPTEVQKPQPVVALSASANRLDAKTPANAASIHGNPQPQGLGGYLAGRSTTAVFKDELEAATASQETVRGMASSANFVSPNPEPATAAMGNSLAAGRSTQAVTVTRDAALGDQSTASANTAAARSPAAATTLHSLSQQYNAAPAAAAAPPMAPPPASPGSVNETVSVTSAAPAIETESTTSSGVIAGMGIGSLQSNKSMMAKKQPTLPSHLPALSTSSNARQELAIDTAGALFRSEDAGVTWRPVSVQWTGRAVKITLVSSPNQRLLAKDTSPAAASSAAAKPSATAPAPAIFELTNDAGELWTSTDGQVWKHK